MPPYVATRDVKHGWIDGTGRRDIRLKKGEVAELTAVDAVALGDRVAPLSPAQAAVEAAPAAKPGKPTRKA